MRTVGVCSWVIRIAQVVSLSVMLLFAILPYVFFRMKRWL